MLIGALQAKVLHVAAHAVEVADVRVVGVVPAGSEPDGHGVFSHDDASTIGLGLDAEEHQVTRPRLPEERHLELRDARRNHRDHGRGAVDVDHDARGSVHLREHSAFLHGHADSSFRVVMHAVPPEC